MREHVAANSGCAKIKSWQYFQTWQIIVLIRFVSFSINDWKENVEGFNPPPSEKKHGALFASVNSPWMKKFFCHFVQILWTAATI